jgi:hypothetical protein
LSSASTKVVKASLAPRQSQWLGTATAKAV